MRYPVDEGSARALTTPEKAMDGPNRLGHSLAQDNAEIS
jgi:hypothetical protein